ncbi:MAG: resE7 [Gammaproteobacteria bacterium]|nr:MAG: resE7 [Gammaproteobacteria bacterium]TND02247.1 MAG: resE7 [Gammaproteobacteria bacterium]
MTIDRQTLCVIDNKPRSISPQQRLALTSLARQVVSQLELRLKIAEQQHLDRAKDDFISMVNHELRTPLTSINGALSLLHHSIGVNLDADAAQMVEISYRNSARRLCLVNDVLDVTRLASGRLPLVRKPLDITALARQAIELNQAYLDQASAGQKYPMTRTTRASSCRATSGGYYR